MRFKEYCGEDDRILHDSQLPLGWWPATRRLQNELDTHTGTWKTYVSLFPLGTVFKFHLNSSFKNRHINCLETSSENKIVQKIRLFAIEWPLIRSKNSTDSCLWVARGVLFKILICIPYSIHPLSASIVYSVDMASTGHEQNWRFSFVPSKKQLF